MSHSYDEYFPIPNDFNRDRIIYMFERDLKLIKGTSVHLHERVDRYNNYFFPGLMALIDYLGDEVTFCLTRLEFRAATENCDIVIIFSIDRRGETINLRLNYGRKNGHPVYKLTNYLYGTKIFRCNLEEGGIESFPTLKAILTDLIHS